MGFDTHSRAILLALMLASTFLPLIAEERGILNENLPSWISLGAQSRFRSEGQRGIGFQDGRDQDFLLIRNRLSIEIQPASWLRFFGEGQDARSVGIPSPNGSVKDTFDLRQAWVSIGSESSWWDLRVGRQMIAYGTERVIGAAEWGNTARVFDAARLSIHNKESKVDIFSASVVNNEATEFDHHEQGNNLHGIYGSLGGVLPQGKLEPFLLYRTNHAARSNSWTGGLRTTGSIGPKWTYELEAIRQNGALPGKDLQSWAATAQVQRFLTASPWRPSIMGEYNFASGDPNPNDSVVNTYDQLYPTNHGIYGFTDQVGRRNTKNARTGLWLRPRKGLVVRSEFHAFWLATRYDAFYSAGGGVSVPAVTGGASATHIGNELNFGAEYIVNHYYTLGAQYGHLYPGAFIKRYSPGAGHDFYAFYIDFRL